MSVSIDTYTLEKRLILSQDSIGAVMDIGSTWTEMRVWMRATMVDNGSSPGAGPQFFLGIMSNPTANMSNGPRGSSTTHFVGVSSGSGSWTRNAGPPVYYSGLSMTACKKVGSTVTASGANGTLGSADADRHLCYGVRIVKGSPNFTFTRCYPASTAPADALINVPLNAELFEHVARQGLMSASRDILNAITGDPDSYDVSTNTTIAVDEGTDGALNALCVSWNSTFQLRVDEILAAKLS